MFSKRVFLLGPSHTARLSTAALSSYTQYSTPFGPLALDLPTMRALSSSDVFTTIPRQPEDDEHSLEMHIPYIHKLLFNKFPSQDDLPPLVPIIIGSTSQRVEKEIAKVLSPYFEDETNLWVISSDFCHWGERFGYTAYLPHPKASSPVDLSRRTPGLKDMLLQRPIHESIAELDQSCIETLLLADNADRFAAWHAELLRTNNTVCGRHPIAVMLALLEQRQEAGQGRGTWVITHQERSSECERIGDSSVSYVSAVCVLE